MRESVGCRPPCVNALGGEASRLPSAWHKYRRFRRGETVSIDRFGARPLALSPREVRLTVATWFATARLFWALSR